MRAIPAPYTLKVRRNLSIMRHLRDSPAKIVSRDIASRRGRPNITNPIAAMTAASGHLYRHLAAKKRTNARLVTRAAQSRFHRERWWGARGAHRSRVLIRTQTMRVRSVTKWTIR